MASENWQIRRLGTVLGAEVTGVVLAETSDAEKAEIRSLLHANKVLFFPGQFMSAPDHIAFGRFFGQLEGHPNLKDANAVEHPELFRLVASTGGIADEWHTDLTFQEQPALMSILNMKQCPEVGGDTMWCDLVAAYEKLSPPLQDLCDGLSALHDAHPHNRPDRMTIHPMIRHDPETGRKALFIHPVYAIRFEDMTERESRPMLDFLNDHATRVEFTCRVRWQPGTLTMWDNRCVQHNAMNDYDGFSRRLHRTTVAGAVPSI